MINIGQRCRRNNAAVKQQSAIKSGYRKCYRTTRIVFCGEQKYWIFYNAIKRSQMITMRWSVRGRRVEGGRERREVNNEARRFVGSQPRRAVSTPLGPIDRRSDKSFSWAEKNNVFDRCTVIAVATALSSADVTNGVSFSLSARRRYVTKNQSPWRAAAPHRAKWLPPFQELSRCRKSLARARQKDERRTERRRKKEEEEEEVEEEERRKERQAGCGGGQRQRRQRRRRRRLPPLAESLK